jgi:hypothetical protein
MQLRQSAVAMKTIPNEGKGHVEQLGQRAHYELRQTFAATCGGDAPNRRHQTNRCEQSVRDLAVTWACAGIANDLPRAFSFAPIGP